MRNDREKVESILYVSREDTGVEGARRCSFLVAQPFLNVVCNSAQLAELHWLVRGLWPIALAGEARVGEGCPPARAHGPCHPPLSPGGVLALSL